MPEPKITKDMTINDIIKYFPTTIGVFNRFNVDSCCGGARTLEATAREDGVDLEALLRELSTATVSPPHPPTSRCKLSRSA